MTILTSRDLHECGICLTDKREEADLLRSVNDALELRVGTALARRLRDAAAQGSFVLAPIWRLAGKCYAKSSKGWLECGIISAN